MLTAGRAVINGAELATIEQEAVSSTVGGLIFAHNLAFVIDFNRKCKNSAGEVDGGQGAAFLLQKAV